MRRYIIFLVGVLTFFSTGAQEYPKREFRGVWIQTIYQPQYAEMDSVQMCAYFDDMLDTLQQVGINALLFQVRPEADAFYSSSLEPWSRFLSGRQGCAPEGGWDPMAALIEKCHRRNIEFHAWINPYRAQCNIATELDSSHIYYRHPEWFVVYGKQLLFDPGWPESRAFIADVVADIIDRYDVDAIHMDDYFYPYPVNGVPFPDSVSYAFHGKGQKLDDWRRNNVNLLVSELSHLIKKHKPWVQFGISPFGIYRNQTSSPDGSATHGLQNYDDLYADVLYWTKQGWVDYLIPQLYWEVGHPAACYEELITWWNRHVEGSCRLYIGEDLRRSLDTPGANPRTSQLGYKMILSRYFERVSGVCFWSGYQLLDNYKDGRTLLSQTFFSYPALVPPSTTIDNLPPMMVKKLRARWTPEGFCLEWREGKIHEELQKASYYCVYRFEPNEKISVEDVRKLVAIVRDPNYLLPYETGEKNYVYAVTAVNRMHNESFPRIIKIKL